MDEASRHHPLRREKEWIRCIKAYPDDKYLPSFLVRDQLLAGADTSAELEPTTNNQQLTTSSR
jgi:hypothetical protein